MVVYDIFLSFLSSFDAFSFIVALIIVGVAWWYVTIPRNLPPGPLGYPIVGSLFSLDQKQSEKDLAKIGQKYGSVFSMYLGSRLFIYLGNYEAIKEAFIKQGENFSGRPNDFLLRINAEDKGITLTDGDVWREHRRFLIMTLRDFGVGKLSLEPKIKDEIQCLTNEIAKANGTPQDLRSPINVSVSNVIMALGFGHRYEYDDEKYRQFLKEASDTGEFFAKMVFLIFFPWLKYVPGCKWFLGLNKFKDIIQKFEKFIKNEIECHKKDYVEGSRKDYIDAFLTERQSIIEKTGNEGTFDMKELQDNLGALFGAGSGTLTTTLLWTLMFLLIHPEVQQKLQKEIDDVIGMERTPSTTDRINMPYTEAVLHEVSRCASIVPTNLPHSNIEETTLFGHKIPKRSFILSNLWFAHHDPKYWKDPEEFRPERFLNDKGQVTKPEYLMPFSAGKRICLGESLARMELFLYVTSFFQRFTFSLPKGETISVNHYDTSFSREPKPFNVCAIQRSGYQPTP